MPQFLRWFWKRLAVPRRKPAIRLLFELYALALRNPREYPGVLEDPLSYWQKLTGRTGISRKPNAVEATPLVAATRGLLLDFCATGERSRVERAIEALAEFVEWRATSTEMKRCEPGIIARVRSDKLTLYEVGNG